MRTIASSVIFFISATISKPYSLGDLATILYIPLSLVPFCQNELLTHSVCPICLCIHPARKNICMPQKSICTIMHPCNCHIILHTIHKYSFCMTHSYCATFLCDEDSQFSHSPTSPPYAAYAHTHDYSFDHWGSNECVLHGIF